MKVENWVGQSGDTYREITDKNWQSLKDLSTTYQSEGKRCWLNPPRLSTPQDYIRKDYVLIVRMNKAKTYGVFK